MYQTKYYELHQSDPVKWNRWNRETLDKAKSQGKLLFISIGYSTCHWCHVLQRESFKNEEVAKILNEDYVPVIVDREDKPEVDSLYMKMAQIMNGSGGWPLNVIAVPTGEPIFIASYLPPFRKDDTPGIIEVLSYLRDAWKTDKKSLLEMAMRGVSYLNVEPRASESENVHSDAIEVISNIYDREFGGFGQEPKFPSFTVISYLITFSQVFDNYLFMAEKTFRSIRYGGIYDQFGNGMFRYSMDRRWLIPHFEKMLYDQLMLRLISIRLYRVTGNEFYKLVNQETRDFMERDFLNRETGLYYSSLDADWNGIEGGYYLWTDQDLDKALGDTRNALDKYYTKVKLESGYLLIPPVGADLRSPGIREINSKLLNYRTKREPPEIDDKQIAGFNAFAISVELFEGSKIQKNRIESFLDKFIDPYGGMFRFHRNGKSMGTGILEDYAFTIDMLINYYNRTLDRGSLSLAHKLIKKTNADFYDFEKGGYYLDNRNEKLIDMRLGEEYDYTYPSGNSIMYWNLRRFSEIMETDEFEPFMNGIRERFKREYGSNPIGHISKLDFMLLSDKLYTLHGSEEKVTDVLKKMEYPLNICIRKNEGDYMELCGNGKCQRFIGLDQINYNKIGIH